MRYKINVKTTNSKSDDRSNNVTIITVSIYQIIIYLIIVIFLYVGTFKMIKEFVKLKKYS